MININRVSADNIYDELSMILERKDLCIDKSEKKEEHLAFLKEKLVYSADIKSLEPSIQRRFFTTLMNINKSAYSDFDKVDLILTHGVLLSKGYKLDLTDSEIILLLTTMRYIPIKSYDMYAPVLSSKEILSGIEARTTDEEEQTHIMDDILDMLDEVAYPDMDPEDMRATIAGCTKVISKYQINDSKIK